MSIANLWDRIADAGPAAVVLVAATLALLAIPLLRWLAPHGQRHGGGPARLFLGLAVVLSSSAIAIGTMGVASPGSVLGLVSVLALMIGLPSDDGGTLGCGARSEVVLYRIDDGTLEEVLAADPELAAGLATIAAARQAALEARPGRAPARRRPDGLAVAAHAGLVLRAARAARPVLASAFCVVGAFLGRECRRGRRRRPVAAHPGRRDSRSGFVGGLPLGSLRVPTPGRRFMGSRVARARIMS